MNILEQLKPYADEAEALTKLTVDAMAVQTPLPRYPAVVLAGLVLATTAAEAMGWRPVVMFARLATEGGALFDAAHIQVDEALGDVELPLSPFVKTGNGVIAR